MNPVTEEIESYFGCSSMTDQEYLEHYGMEHLQHRLRRHITQSMIARKQLHFLGSCRRHLYL